jgi:hypothetical protein
MSSIKGKKAAAPAKASSPAAKKAAPKKDYFIEAGEYNNYKMFYVKHEEGQDFPDLGIGLGKLKKLVTVPGWAKAIEKFVASEGQSVA